MHDDPDTELRSIHMLVFIVTAIPLIIYPGVLMASIMGLAAPVRPDTPLPLLISARTFLISSLLYPIGWVAGIMLPRILGMIVVITHLAVCLISFAMWYTLCIK